MSVPVGYPQRQMNQVDTLAVLKHRSRSVQERVLRRHREDLPFFFPGDVVPLERLGQKKRRSYFLWARLAVESQIHPRKVSSTAPKLKATGSVQALTWAGPGKSCTRVTGDTHTHALGSSIHDSRMSTGRRKLGHSPTQKTNCCAPNPNVTARSESQSTCYR